VLKLKRDNIYNVTGDINMKITKQRLKEIIKEELENSQNEGKWGDFASAMYGRAKAALGFGNKYWDGSSGIEKKFKPMVDNFLDEYPDIDRLSSGQLRQLIDDALALTDDYIDGAEARIGNDAYYTMDKDQKERYMVQSDRLSKIIRAALAIVNEKAQSERDQKEAEELARKARRKEEERKEANEKWRKEYYANKKDKKDPLDARPNAWMGSVDRKAKTFGYGANESKITKSALKALIAEELSVAEKGKK
jgi:hypothetical protein